MATFFTTLSPRANTRGTRTMLVVLCGAALLALVPQFTSSSQGDEGAYRRFLALQEEVAGYGEAEFAPEEDDQSLEEKIAALQEKIASIEEADGMLRRSRNDPEQDQKRTWHSVRALIGLPDPKSTSIRAVYPEQHEQPRIPPQKVGRNPNLRLIPAAPADLHKFSYQMSNEEHEGPKSHCVNPQDVLNVRNAIKILFDDYNIRAFPRNGFLLGVVRHGGLLPIEQIDFDVGVIYEDLLPLIDPNVGLKKVRVGDDFEVKPQETEDFWANWNGNDPGTGERYSYFGAMFRFFFGDAPYRMHAQATYPYRDTGVYFYPRADKAGFNYDSHMQDAMRYNEEGAGYTMVDTDERMSEETYAEGKQMGNIFNTNFECFQEVQFYFTTIYVPCDYDAILTSQYGENWRHVEKRGGRGGPRHPTSRVGEEEEEEILAAGPFPVCAGLWETLRKAQEGTGRTFDM